MNKLVIESSSDRDVNDIGLNLLSNSYDLKIYPGLGLRRQRSKPLTMLWTEYKKHIHF